VSYRNEVRRGDVGLLRMTLAAMRLLNIAL